MSAATVSRGGWNVQHLRHGDAAGGPASSATRSERRRLLKEAMRALDPSDTVRQAKRNRSIVEADTHLNRAYVNDGNGGFRELTPEEGVEPVLQYGDARIDAVRRKWNPKSFETSTMISWVPKSLLKEIPGYYPVYSKKGREVGRRSRWVMPDDEAGRKRVQEWFETTHGHLVTDVLRGGHDAVAGVVWNYDESSVHVHWMFDTMAPEVRDIVLDEHQQVLGDDGAPVMWHGKEKHLGKLIKLTKDGCIAAAPEIAASQVRGIDGNGYLTDADGEHLLSVDGEPVRGSESLRVEAQQVWGQSHEVTRRRVVDGVERDVVITGATKMREYQESYRERLLEQGFEIEREVNPRGTSLKKGAYAALDAERMELEGEQEEFYSREEDLDAWEAKLETLESQLAAEQSRLDEARADWGKRRPALENAAAAEAREKALADWEEHEKPVLIAEGHESLAAERRRWEQTEKPELTKETKRAAYRGAVIDLDEELRKPLVSLAHAESKLKGESYPREKFGTEIAETEISPGAAVRMVVDRTEKVVAAADEALSHIQAEAEDLTRFRPELLSAHLAEEYERVAKSLRDGDETYDAKIRHQMKINYDKLSLMSRRQLAFESFSTETGLQRETRIRDENERFTGNATDRMQARAAERAADAPSNPGDLGE